MTETLFRHEQLMHAHDGDIRHSLARERKIGIEKEEEKSPWKNVFLKRERSVERRTKALSICACCFTIQLYSEPTGFLLPIGIHRKRGNGTQSDALREIEERTRRWCAS